MEFEKVTQLRKMIADLQKKYEDRIAELEKQNIMLRARIDELRSARVEPVLQIETTWVDELKQEIERNKAAQKEKLDITELGLHNWVEQLLEQTPNRE